LSGTTIRDQAVFEELTPDRAVLIGVLGDVDFLHRGQSAFGWAQAASSGSGLCGAPKARPGGRADRSTAPAGIQAWAL
jgi:hypothetical protein